MLLKAWDRAKGRCEQSYKNIHGVLFRDKNHLKDYNRAVQSDRQSVTEVEVFLVMLLYQNNHVAARACFVFDSICHVCKVDSILWLATSEWLQQLYTIWNIYLLFYNYKYALCYKTFVQLLLYVFGLCFRCAAHLGFLSYFTMTVGPWCLVENIMHEFMHVTQGANINFFGKQTRRVVKGWALETISTYV